MLIKKKIQGVLKIINKINVKLFLKHVTTIR